jgi:hypothetical protein
MTIGGPFKNTPCLTLKEPEENLNSRKLKKFNEIELMNDHALPEKFLPSESDLM